MQIIEGIQQGSDEWKELRLGVITASRFKDVIAKGQGKTRKSYMYQLAAEILTGEFQDSYTNEIMQWGFDTEAQARSMYEFRNDLEVKEVSFVKGLKMIGCSPDGLVGNDGLVEFKCPKTTTQIETFMNAAMPSYHKAQVQGQILVCEREWCDFVSFDPRINGAASWFSERIYRDDMYIKELHSDLKIFRSELINLVDTLEGEANE